jgi:hypothetical protein
MYSRIHGHGEYLSLQNAPVVQETLKPNIGTASDAQDIPTIVIEPPPANENLNESTLSSSRERGERVVRDAVEIPTIVVEPPPPIEIPEEIPNHETDEDVSVKPPLPGPPAIVISAAPPDVEPSATGKAVEASAPAIAPRITIEPPPAPDDPPAREERGRQLHVKPKRNQRRHSVHDVPRQPAAVPVPAVAAPAPLPRTPHPVALQPEDEKLIDKTPKGWRMRTRVVNPAQPDSTRSVDIVFVHLFSRPKSQKAGVQPISQPLTHQNTSERSLPELLPSLKRAKTLIDEPSNKKDKKKPLLPSFVPPPPAANEGAVPDGKKSRNANVHLGDRSTKGSKAQPIQRNTDPDWLTRTDMLPKHLPNGRIIKVAFDLNPALASPLNFVTAGTQLAEYLHEIQKDSPNIPTVFLGHSYGGVFLIQTLVDAARTDHTSQSLLNRTAGVFLLSCTNICSPALAKLVADHVCEKPSAKLFTEMAGGMPALNVLANTFKFTVFDRKPPKKEQTPSKNLEDAFRRGITPIRLGFPVVQFISRDEKPDSQKSRPGTTSEFLKLPNRTLLLDRSFHDALRFSGPDDPDFLRIIMLIQSGIRSHSFLHTVAFGNRQNLKRLMKDGFNVNIRDRW